MWLNMYVAKKKLIEPKKIDRFNMAWLLSICYGIIARQEKCMDCPHNHTNEGWLPSTTNRLWTTATYLIISQQTE